MALVSKLVPARNRRAGVVRMGMANLANLGPSRSRSVALSSASFGVAGMDFVFLSSWAHFVSSSAGFGKGAAKFPAAPATLGFAAEDLSSLPAR